MLGDIKEWLVLQCSEMDGSLILDVSAVLDEPQLSLGSSRLSGTGKGRETGLMTDDTAFMRMSLRNVLEKNGYEVVGGQPTRGVCRPL